MPASPGARPGPPRLFYGWIVVAGAFLILFMAYGTQYAFGVFFAALLDEFGWSRGQPLRRLLALRVRLQRPSPSSRAGSPIAGGRARSSRSAASSSASGWIAMSRVSRALAALRVLRRRGRARHVHRLRALQRDRGAVVRRAPRPRRSGLAIAGGSLGTFALPPVAHVLVSAARLALGLRRLRRGDPPRRSTCSPPLMRRDPESLGLAPDGDARHRRRVRAARSGADWTIGQAHADPGVLDALRALRARPGSPCSSPSCTWCRWPGARRRPARWPRRS